MICSSRPADNRARACSGACDLIFGTAEGTRRAGAGDAPRRPRSRARVRRGGRLPRDRRGVSATRRVHPHGQSSFARRSRRSRPRARADPARAAALTRRGRPRSARAKLARRGRGRAPRRARRAPRRAQRRPPRSSRRPLAANVPRDGHPAAAPQARRLVNAWRRGAHRIVGWRGAWLDECARGATARSALAGADGGEKRVLELHARRIADLRR